MSPLDSQEQAKGRACLHWRRIDPVGAELGSTVFFINKEQATTRVRKIWW